MRLVSRDLAIAAVIGVAIFAAYLPGHMGCSDSRWSIPTAISLLDEHNFDLNEFPELLRDRGLYFTERVGDRYYTLFPFGASVIAAPAVAALRPLASKAFRMWPSLRRSMEVSQWTRGCPPARGEPVLALHSWTEHIIASFIVSLTAVLLFGLARAEASAGAAAVVALIFTFATPAWTIASRSLWQHGPSMLMLVIAVFVIRRGSPLALAGAALAAAYAVRPTNALPCAIFSAYVAWQYRRQVLPYLVGAVLVLVPFFAVNRHVYRAWFSPYYHPSYFHGNPFYAEALAGTLFSPGRGLLIYSPVLAFAAGGLALKLRERRFSVLDSALVVCIVLHWAVVTYVNPDWWGGDTYGSRPLTDIVPFLILLLVPFVEWLRTARHNGRSISAAAFGVAAIVSVLMHAQGVLNPAAMAWNHEPTPVANDLDRLWDWRHPPFLAGWVHEPAARVPDVAALACTSPPGPPTDLAVLSNDHSVVTLSWTAGTGAVALYAVESGTAPGASATTRDALSTTLKVTHIPPGTYYARVRARNGCGVSAPSNEISVTVR